MRICAAIHLQNSGWMANRFAAYSNHKIAGNESDVGASRRAPMTNSGSGIDSATVHYWGFNTPLSLAAGGCSSYTEYLTTNLNAAGGGGAAVNTAVPTLSTWGLLLLITLIGGISLWSVRRKLR